ncbi:MAG: T9SS type A sorting domain-containing protein [Ignavibacteriales bacterium]|nr:T9SS type A sorting domain-containing protein [Ignavibacteriales bacterium]
MKIYDVLGRVVKELVNENQKPGNYSIEFDGSNLSSGIYYYTVSAGEFSVTKKCC